ncbi:MAG: hypothetical protein D3904_01510 [Candidatus Electrothrix sp. EH2]|nr:hypothetical protein [Candidatus Electrothrix sp. EH2]
MFYNKILKSIACILLITYCSTAGLDLAWAIDPAWATEEDSSEFPLLAQVYTNRTPEKETAWRQQKIYTNKAQRIEEEINKIEGKKEFLIDVIASSAFVGAGLFFGANEIEKTINDIELEPENIRGEKDKENALDALESVEQVGLGVAGVGVLSAIGYVTYSVITGRKADRKEKLLEEPENLEVPPAVEAVNNEIDRLKRIQSRRKNTQHFFSSIAIGSLMTGGLLWGLSGPLRDNISDIEIHDNDIAEQLYRDEALEAADDMENWGKGLVIAGVVSWGISKLFGKWAKDKEENVHELEKGLLRANHHIDIAPRPDGFVFMYSYNY